MTVSAIGAGSAHETFHVPQSPRPVTWRDRLRWGIPVGWLALLAVAVVGGARQASWDDLVTGIEAGTITEVSVAGGPLAGGGSPLQDVTWRDGLLQRRVEVLWETADTTSTTSTTDPDSTPMTVLDQDAVEELRSLAPALQIERESRSTLTELRFSGWSMPFPEVSGALAGCGWLAWLYLVMNAPAPWLATRWAWFWLGSLPFGVLAFALLSGPTPGLPHPRRPQRRLTGGWALLLTIVGAPMLVGLVS